MTSYDKDEVPMLSDVQHRSVQENVDSRLRPISRTWSTISIPTELYETEPNLVGYTGPLRRERKVPVIQMSGPIYINRKADNVPGQNSGLISRKMADSKTETFLSFNGMDHPDKADDLYSKKNEHLLRSGQLGMCNDPYCTTCPMFYSSKPEQPKTSAASAIFDYKYNSLYGDAKGWARRFLSFVYSCIPGVMNPHAKVVQQWNKCFVICCGFAIFLDPLFFFLLSVKKGNNCIVISWPLTKTIAALRSVTDFMYLLNILLQFRLAYIAPESRVVGAGELVDHPKKIAKNYFCGFFFLDLFIMLPLPQVIMLAIIPKRLGKSGANYNKNLMRVAILVQYIPRLYRFSPLLIGASPSGFVFETAWANFVINLLTFMLSGHVVGSFWYLFGLQRVNQCLRVACINSVGGHDECMSLIDCGHGNKDTWTSANLKWKEWTTNDGANACFTEEGFSYGIYKQAVNLTTHNSALTRYVFSLFWGFQQISTLAGNQTPSYFVLEVVFTMAIIGVGLLLFAFLIGNIQNFLQALGRRRLEMSLRRRDVEQWMSHRRLPQELRRKVLEAERFKWAATRGVNEGILLDSLPEDLQKDIRRHLFKFVKKVWTFASMDEHVLDSICERLKQQIFINGGEIFSRGGPVEKMVFIVRGKLESIGEDGTITPLSVGNVCGEELLSWCLEHSSVSKDGKKRKNSSQRLVSSRTVRCLSNVEAFSLHAADLEEVTKLFARNLRNPRIQGAMRYESPYWRGLAASRIQVAWRYRQKRLKRMSTSQSNQS